jgi:tetratricopeptide (TPR) repeat protein
MSAPALQKKHWAACVFAAAFFSQFLVLIRFSDSPHFLPSSDDMKFYNDWALRIAGGQLSDGQAFYGLPGYAYGLAAIYSVVGFDPFVVGLLQALMFAGVATTIFLFGCRFSTSSDEHVIPLKTENNCTIGLIAAAGWVVFVPAQVFSVILMPTVWLVLAHWGLVLWLATRTRCTVWKPWLMVGAAIGVFSTVVATILFALPLALVAILRSVGKDCAPRDRSLRWLIAAAVLFVGVFAGMSPAWLHNRFVAREPVLLSAHSGINMWIGNNPIADGYPRIPPGLRASQEGLLRDSVTLASTAAGRPLKRYEVSAYWTQKANDWIRENRAAWVRLLYIKFENFWNALQYDDLSTIKLLQTAGVVLPGPGFGFVAALGLPGLIGAAWRYRAARWVAAVVALHLIAMLPVFITERYRLAAVPGLLLGASFLVCSLYRSLATRGKRLQTAGLILASALGVALVTIPRGEPGVWSLDHYKAGIRALDLGELETAERELKTAYAYVPTGAEINFALGNLWYAKRNFAWAKHFYRRTLELDFRHASALNNLGVIMIEEQRWGWAEKFLSRSAAIEPEDSKTLYLLALSQFQAGKRVEAAASIRAARALNPHQAEFLELEEKIRK